jgi:hypothetical protein
MKIEHIPAAFVIDGLHKYLRLDEDTWYVVTNLSMHKLNLSYSSLEDSFQKQEKEDFLNDKYA